MNTTLGSTTVDASKSTSNSGRRHWLMTACVVLSLSSGCAVLNPGTPEEQVQRRAQTRWESLTAHRFNDAYNLLAPSLRQLMPQDRWVRRFGTAATWKSAEVLQVTCKDSRCNATVRLTAVAPVLGGRSPEITTHLDETWVLENNAWWYFQKL